MRVFIQNRGPSQIKTNYWRSDMERSGRYHCSVLTEAGELHLLLPRKFADIADDAKRADCALVSVGPEPKKKAKHAIQFLFEDHSQKPLALVLAGNACDNLPYELSPDLDWKLSVWVLRDDKPFRALHLPCQCRRSASLPDFSPFDPVHDTGFKPSIDPPVLKLVPKSVVSVSAPRNVIGLPRILARNRGERLHQLLHLQTREARKIFIREPQIVRWVRSRGLKGIQPTQELICSFQADRRQRMKVFELFISTGKVKYSLEQLVISEHFMPAVTAKKLDRQLLHGTLTGIADVGLLHKRLDAAVDQTCAEYRHLWMIWPMVFNLLRRWSELSPQEREPPILGLYLLVTLSCSLEPVLLAQLIVPQLSREFSKLRVVYWKIGPRVLQSLDEPQRLEFLWRVKLRRLRCKVLTLRRAEPSVAAIGTLREQVSQARQLHRQRMAVGSKAGSLRKI